jgi:hypothetical protein
MGYITAPNGSLVCDACLAQGAKLRKCPYWVTELNGQRLRYCIPSALCAACFAKVGGSSKLHAKCKQGAAESQAEINAKGARLEAGEMFVQCAFGYGDRGLPPGAGGVLFRGLNGAQTWRLVDGAGYRHIQRAKGTMTALSDFPGAPVWENNPDVTTKQVD